MGLGLDIGAFLTGVQEGGQEIDETLTNRFKTLSEGKDDTNLKTKFAKEVDNYDEDKKLLKAVKSAYASNDWAKAQQLLGGFDSLDAYWKARELNSDIYYKLPKLGEEPVFTKADYGVTNDTTVSRMVESFLNPEAYKKRKESETPTAATYTKYGRKTDEEGNIVYARSEKEVDQTKLDLMDLQKSYRHKSKPDEITTIIPDPKTKGHWLEITLHKNQNREETSLGTYSKDMIKATGNKEIGKGYSISNVKGIEQANQIPRGSEIEFVRQGVIVDSKDNILENQKQLLKLTNGESTDGRRLATVSVKAKRTNNTEDEIMMHGETHTGWIYMHEKVEPLDKVAKKDQLTVLVQNKHTDRTDNKTFGTDALGRTKYTLHLTEDGLTGDKAKKLGVNEDNTYTYAGYYVTNIEDDFDVDLETTQDWVEQQWVLNGDIVKKGTKGAQYLDVTFKAKFTGEDSDSITHFKDHDNAYTESGWRLVGQDIANPTDARTNKQKEMDEDVKRIMLESSLGVDYSGIIKRLKIVDKNGNPLPLTPEIASIIVERRDMLKVTEEGEIIDVRASQFEEPTPLYELEPEGWSNVNQKQVEKYSLGYFGKVKGTEYYKKMEKAKHYMGWINSKARTWANAYYMDEAEAVSVVERLALLGVQKEPNNRDLNDLWFNQFGTVHRHPTKNIEYSLDDLFAQARAFKNLDSQRNRTWHQSLTKFFEAIQLDEAALKTLRNE